MPKYIIHIGPPKTGSKYIQSQLFHLRKFLQTKGVVYPDIWWSRPDKIMHDWVFEALRAGEDLKADFDRLNSCGAEKIVLSCEAFDGLARPLKAFRGLGVAPLERLREYISGNNVDIIYYARRWSDRIPSDWRQQVMMGQYLTLPEYYIRFLNNPEETGQFNYSKVWEFFERIFGRGSLRIVSFSNLADHKVDLFDHFCSVILGVQEAPKLEEGLIQKNLGYDMIDAEILRGINYMYQTETSLTDYSMRIKFGKLKESYDLRMLRERMKTDIRMIELRDNAVPLRTTWEAVNSYRDRLVSPEYGHDIFDRRDVAVEFVGQNYLLQSLVAEEIRKLYRFLVSAIVEDPDLPA
jgi:hypothetical protein